MAFDMGSAYGKEVGMGIDPRQRQVGDGMLVLSLPVD